MKIERLTELDPETDRTLRAHSGSALRLAQKAIRPRVEWLIARRSDGTLGAGCRLSLWEGWTTIQSLWVHPTERGKGYGKELLEVAAEYARSRGGMGLDSIAYSFEASQFFLQCGYVAFARLKINDAGAEKLWLVNSFHPISAVQPPAKRDGRRVKREERKSGSKPTTRSKK